MFYFVALAGLAVVVAIIHIALLKGRRIFSAGQKAVAGSLWLIAVASALWGNFAMQELRHEMQRRTWPTTAGVITESRVSETRTHYPIIRYKYAIDSVEYAGITDLNTPMFGGKAKRFETSERVVAAYRPGQKVVVYYNPQNPGESFLTPTPKWNVFMQVGLALFVYGVALFFAFNLSLGKRALS